MGAATNELTDNIETFYLLKKFQHKQATEFKNGGVDYKKYK